jgi:hypothetical protein
MTSDRMMQAIGRIERAISRLETTVDKVRSRAREQARDVAEANRRADALATETERLRAEQAEGAPAQGDLILADPFSHDKAVAALRSLDALIDDLQKAQRNG